MFRFQGWFRLSPLIGRTALVLLGLALVAAIASRGGLDNQAQATSHPAYLDIRSATINDYDPPADPADVASRVVTLEIVVGGDATAACAALPPYLAYGFLIDADKLPSTNNVPPNPSLFGQGAFDDIGVDYRLGVECIGGLFFDTFGGNPGVYAAGPDTTTFTVATTVGQLPSVDFRWIAFAQLGSTFTRLPARGQHMRFTTFERATW